MKRDCAIQLLLFVAGVMIAGATIALPAVRLFARGPLGAPYALFRASGLALQLGSREEARVLAEQLRDAALANGGPSHALFEAEAKLAALSELEGKSNEPHRSRMKEICGALWRDCTNAVIDRHIEMRRAVRLVAANPCAHLPSRPGCRRDKGIE